MQPNLPLIAARSIANSVGPLLTDLGALPALGDVVKHKGGDHTAHRIDYVAEQVLFDVVRAQGFDGCVFSEESGLTRLGSAEKILVCDPYCNTTLTFRSYRESAVAVYEYGFNGILLGAAIADLQVPRIVHAPPDGAWPVLHKTWEADSSISAPAATSSVCDLTEAFVVVSLLKRSRRQDLPLELLHQAGLISTIDGAIVALRMCTGEVDAFVDLVGQPTYEAIAYDLVRRAGGTVTSADGRPFDAAELVGRLLREDVGRHSLIAAANPVLHATILEVVARGRSSAPTQ